jgi:hypothetical protein
MKNKSLLISISSLIITIVALSMIAITYGWFSKQVTLTSQYVSVGEIVYLKSGAWLDTEEPIVPSNELIAESFILDNQSNISSQLRIRIEYTYYDSVEDEIGELITYTGVGDYLFVDMPSEFFYYDDNLEDEIPGYWYFSATDYAFQANSGPLTILSSLYYDGNKTSIDFASKSVTIKITIQVKQTNNLVWNDLTTYDFQTGYLLQ